MARALIVEDEPLIRELAAHYLREAGYEVCDVAVAEDGLAVLHQDRNWDVLFADIAMPGAVDGWELGQMAKLLVPHLGVIYASGKVGGVALSDREAFLEKPYFYEDIQKALEAVAPRALH